MDKSITLPAWGSVDHAAEFAGFQRNGNPDKSVCAVNSKGAGEMVDFMEDIQMAAFKEKVEHFVKKRRPLGVPVARRTYPDITRRTHDSNIIT